MARCAFLGLGVMGYPMAGHLAAAGHDVTVYNRTGAKADAWVARHGGAARPTPARGRRGGRVRDGLRRQRRRPARGLRRRGRRLRGHGRRRGLRGPHHRQRRGDARPGRGRDRGGHRLCRRAGVGRPGGRGERPAGRDVRRRPGRFRPRRARDRRLRQGVPPHGRRRRGPDDEDGQPDLHRGAPAGPVRGHGLRQGGRARRGGGGRRHPGRGRRILADGQPPPDDAGGRVRPRLRGRLDAQGSGDLPAGIRDHRRGAAGARRWSTSSTRTCRRWAAGGGTRPA